MTCCCSPFGPPAPAGELSNVFWVDGATTVVGGDGTDERPFATVTAAVAAVPDGSTLLVCAFDYSGEATINLTKWLNFWGQGDGEDVLLPVLTWDAGTVINFKDCTVTLDGVNDAEIGMWDSFVVSGGEDCLAIFTASGGSFSGNQIALTAENCDCSGGVGSGFVSQVELNHCRVVDVLTTGGNITLLDCFFPGGGSLEGASVSMDRVSEYRAATSGASPSVLPTPLEPRNPIFGSGATGSVLLNAGSVLLNPSDEYDNLTLQGTGAVRCENAILRVRNLLDISVCNALAIRDYTGGGGAAGAGAAGGGAWGGVAGAPAGNSGTLQAPSGANGVVGGVGAQATNVPTLSNAYGGKGGGSGAGGTGAAGAGGAARAAATVTNERITPHWPLVFVGPGSTVAAGSVTTTPVPIMGGHVGQGGSSGAGDAGGAGNAGGGGGGAGRGGGSVVVYARGIRLGPGTTAGAISAAGQPGGAGGNAPGGNSGGGSAGAGGGGGFVLIAYEWIIGSQPAGDEVTASGGAGAVGGNGLGTGTGGAGSDGGAGGQIVFWNVLTNQRTIVLGAAGTAGGAPVGLNGGAAGAAGVCTADFP